MKKLHPAAELAAYKSGIARSAAELDQEEHYLRLAAEFDNYKKRTARQFAEIVKNANEELIQELLGVLDDFEHAFGAMSNAGQGKAANGETVMAGMKMIYDKLIGILKGRGVEQFDAIDQPFDPQFHDAVMQLPSDKDEGTVIGVVTPGYMLNDKVIRHARVIVASSKQA